MPRGMTKNFKIMIAQQLAPVLAFITQLLSTAAAVSRIGALPALIAKVPGACRELLANLRRHDSHVPTPKFYRSQCAPVRTLPGCGRLEQDERGFVLVRAGMSLNLVAPF